MTRYLHKRSVQLGLGLGAVRFVTAALTAFVLPRQPSPPTPNFSNADVNAAQGLVQHSPAGFMGVALTGRTPTTAGNEQAANYQFHPETWQPGKVSTLRTQCVRYKRIMCVRTQGSVDSGNAESGGGTGTSAPPAPQPTTEAPQPTTETPAPAPGPAPSPAPSCQPYPACAV